MSEIKRLRLPETHPVLGSTKVFQTFQYAPAVTAGGLVFIAGQVGLRPDGTIPDTPKEQIRFAFDRLGAILDSLGLDFTNLVELVSYHVDLSSQLANFREVKEQYIKSDFPAWTILGVASLARPELVIEIKAVAAARK
jgi:enamine deaminase RidA (YjgF/YER057c/UK114 family)